MAEFAQLAVVQALAGALMHFLWQGALVALAALTLMRVARGAGTRYAIGIVALVAMLAAPMATFLSLLDSQSELTASAVAGTVSETPALPSREIAVPSTPGNTFADETWWPVASVFVWMSGILVLSVRLAGGWLVARRMATRAVRPAADHVQAVAAALAERLALRRAVQVLESSAVAVPVLVGWIRPAVVFPVAALAGLSPAQIEALLAHELAHVLRHDYLVNLLQSFAEVVLFYHPAVWWLSRRIRTERELCCDDLAVGVCDRLVYATALTDLAAMRYSRVALAATGGDLLARVRRILGREEPSMSSNVRWIPAVVVSAGMLVAVPVLLASVHQTPIAAAPDSATAVKEAVVLSADTVPDALAAESQQSAAQLSSEELSRLIEELKSRLLAQTGELRAYALTLDDQQPPERAEQDRREAEQRTRQTEIENARRELERARRMYETGLATRAQVAEAEAALAMLEAGKDEQRRGEIQIEAARKRLEDARRRFETGLITRDEVARAEAELAQLEARGDSRRLFEAQVRESERRLARNRELFERGLLSSNDLRDAEKLMREAEQKQKTDMSDERFKELVAQAEKAQGEEQQRLMNQLRELEKALVDRRQGTRDADLKKQQEFRDLMARFAQTQSEYARALKSREFQDVASRYRNELREVAPEPRESAEALEAVPSRPIVAGDMLFITIEGESLLPTIYRVEGGGSVRVPLLGSFKVIGQTPGQVREAIGKRLMDAKLGSPAKVSVEIRRNRERQQPSR